MDGRKKGGQPGNKNAQKHGFYSKNFKPMEAEDLDFESPESLRNEAAMMRVMIRRVVELASGPESGTNLEEAITALNALGSASVRLASLLRAEKNLAAAKSNTAEAINQALAEALAEMRGENK